LPNKSPGCTECNEGGIVEMKGQKNNQEKNYTRREFVQQSGLLSAGVFLAGSKFKQSFGGKE
jgi:hypothetical protein